MAELENSVVQVVITLNVIFGCCLANDIKNGLKNVPWPGFNGYKKFMVYKACTLLGAMPECVYKVSRDAGPGSTGTLIQMARNATARIAAVVGQEGQSKDCNTYRPGWPVT